MLLVLDLNDGIGSFASLLPVMNVAKAGPTSAAPLISLWVREWECGNGQDMPTILCASGVSKGNFCGHKNNNFSLALVGCLWAIFWKVQFGKVTSLMSPMIEKWQRCCHFSTLRLSDQEWLVAQKEVDFTKLRNSWLFPCCNWGLPFWGRI